MNEFVRSFHPIQQKSGRIEGSRRACACVWGQGGRERQGKGETCRDGGIDREGDTERSRNSRRDREACTCRRRKHEGINVRDRHWDLTYLDNLGLVT